MSFRLFVNAASFAWRYRIACAVALVLVVGVFLGRYLYPREVEVKVDREIVKVVERLLPGETRTVFRDVPGPTRTEVVRIPLEVSRIVREPGPERIVTVTQPVNVPVETIVTHWPQSITVRVGGVLSGGVWYSPDYPEVTIGQVTPGAYAVSALMPGWRVESVRTETRVDSTPSPPLFQRGFTFGIRADFRGDSPGVFRGDVVYRNLFLNGEYQIRVPVVSINGGPQYTVTWDKRW